MPTQQVLSLSSPQADLDAGRGRLVCGGAFGDVVLDAGPYCLLDCPECGAATLIPHPTEAELDEAYQSGTYATERGQVAKPLDLVLNWLNGKRLDFVDGRRGAGRRLLDVGSGKGRLLRVARSRGFDVTGVEPHSKRAQFSLDRYGVRVFNGPLERFPADESRFDLVVLWHVLEHVPDPVAFLQLVRPLLAADGRLLVEVPNIRDWARRVTGRHWFSLVTPVHLVHFSPAALRLVAEQAGFTVERETTFSVEYGAACWVFSLVNLLGGVDDLLFRALKRNWTPESAADWARLSRTAAATLLVAALSPLLAAVSWYQAGRGEGAVVRMVLRKRLSTVGSPSNLRDDA